MQPGKRSNPAKELFESLVDSSPQDRARLLAAYPPEVRLEVEELLACHEAAGDFLRPLAEQLLPPEAPILQPGTVLRQRFVVERLLKQGGFSRVYLGRDAHLSGKEVVIKVLDYLDDTALARVANEVRAVSSVNHPGVVGIYDHGLLESGQPFLVMEYVAGETLAEAIARDSEALTHPVRLLRQIAHALEAAHLKKVCHLDLKPENIVLARSTHNEWLPVLIDFGIAQIAGVELPAESIGGSPGYMAPEQEQGEGTAKSDIYALGMLARRLRHVPAGSAAVRRATSADPGQRQNSALEFAGELEAEQESRARLKIYIPAAAVLCGLLALLFWLPGRGSRPQSLQPVPVTSALGFERRPAFCPDGKGLFFVGGEGSQSNLYFRRLNEDQPVRLTNDQGDDEHPACSPDGQQVAFIHQAAAAPSAQVLVIMNLDGSSRREYLRGQFIHSLVWSGDGRHLFVSLGVQDHGHHRLSVFDTVAGTISYDLTSPPGTSLGDINPALSPDGRRLAFCRYWERGSADLFVLELDGRLRPKEEPGRLTHERRRLASPQWTPDGKEILFTAGSLGYMSLWRMPADGSSKPQAVNGPFQRIENISIPRDSWKLAYAVDLSDANLWRLSLAQNGLHVRSADRLAASSFNDEEPQYSPDGKRIVFVSGRSGTDQVWLSSADGEEVRQMTHLEGVDIVHAFWAGDSERLLLGVQYNNGGTSGFWLDVKTQQTRELWKDGMPVSLSRDGRFAYVRGSRPERSSIWRVDLETGEWKDPLPPDAWYVVETLDGRGVLYTRRSEAEGIFYQSLKDDENWRIEAPLRRRTLFAPMREGVYFVQQGAGETQPPTLRYYRYKDRSIQVVYTFPGPDLFWGLSLSPDERSILYSQLDVNNTDVLVINGFH
jgi:Tol biopolymer transport system component/tRNA A-37 threonylcarbamoyl transferase component Bud32